MKGVLRVIFLFAAAVALADEAAWMTRLDEWEASGLSRRPEAARHALEELRLDAEQRAVFYQRLKSEGKQLTTRRLHCLVLAELARALKRPDEEISAADDLLLTAAPDLPQGWLGRAEHYLSSKDKNAAAWAAEAAAQALRHARLDHENWRADLRGTREVDWLAHMARTGHLADWMKALASALSHAPRGAARLDAHTLVLATLRLEEARKLSGQALALIETLIEQQPHLVLGDAANFEVLMRDFEGAGNETCARGVARMLVMAEVPQEIAAVDAGCDSAAEFEARWLAQERGFSLAEARALRNGHHELLGLWEHTTPRYQPGTMARQILRVAMQQDESFVARGMEAARRQPWNENLATHTLLAAALTGSEDARPEELLAGLDEVARARVTLRVAAFAPGGSRAASPWLEALARQTVKGAREGHLEPRQFENLLSSLEGMAQGGAPEMLGRVLDDAARVTPRPDDIGLWRRYGALVARQQDAGRTLRLAEAWRVALGQTTQQKKHLPPITLTAIEAAGHGGGLLADLAFELWLKHEAQMSTTALAPPGEAARVGEALLACGRVERFKDFVKALQEIPQHRRNSLYDAMIRELAALAALLDGKSGKAPAVDIWTCRGAEPDAGPSLQWRWALPELGLDPYRGFTMTTGDRDGRTPDDKLRSARWWRAGMPLEALHKPGLDCTVSVLAGETPRQMREFRLGTTPWPEGMPAAGCLRTVVRSRSQPGVQATGMLRPYSTHPAVFSTGREPHGVRAGQMDDIELPACPDLDAVAQPASWLPEERLRWGRLIAPPVKIEDGMEYLLSEWQDPRAAVLRLILLDAQQRPLGPVPVVSGGWQEGKPTPLSMPLNVAHGMRIQRFRPNDWEGDGDVVFPADGRAAAMKPAFMAFVTREPDPRVLPLIQLRPFRSEEEQRKFADDLDSAAPQLPELNDEHLGDLGFAVHAWHVTFASDRGIITGKGMLAGFDVTKIPWKPLVRAESPLIEGNEWPMIFMQERANIIEPSWNGTRQLGLRFLPFDARGERYAACRRVDLPMPTYTRGEISEWLDGAVLMVASQPGPSPEPVCAWVEPDGQTHVVSMPRPPLEGTPGLEVAWWGPGGTRFTLHEAGMLFHMEHDRGLRLLKMEPGSPDDIPEGCSPGRSKRKRSYRLERPDVLAQLDKKTSAVLRRFHLPKPCEGTPMAFDSQGWVVLFTTDHEIIRVNPPPLERAAE